MYKNKKEPGLPAGMVNKPSFNKPAPSDVSMPTRPVARPGMGKPMKPGMGKPMKPGASNLPAGMVNKPSMNKDMAAKKEAIRRMRGDR